jgi:23S rRNA maturation mini-RNase III
MRIIEELFEEASKVGGRVVLFMSSSTGRDKDKDNPMECSDKKEYLEKMITHFIKSDVPFEIICGNPVVAVFGYVARHRPKEVTIILGNEEEKVTMGESIRKGFFDAYVPRYKKDSDQATIDAATKLASEKTEERRRTYGGITLTLKYMDRPPDSISATIVRRHVTAKNKAGFNALYEGYLQQKNKNGLFMKIQNGMNRIERNFNNNGRNSNNGRKTKKAKTKSASKSPPKSRKTA